MHFFQSFFSAKSENFNQFFRKTLLPLNHKSFPTSQRQITHHMTRKGDLARARTTRAHDIDHIQMHKNNENEVETFFGSSRAFVLIVKMKFHYSLSVSTSHYFNYRARILFCGNQKNFQKFAGQFFMLSNQRLLNFYWD